jgi:hypothetical protein
MPLFARYSIPFTKSVSGIWPLAHHPAFIFTQLGICCGKLESVPSFGMSVFETFEYFLLCLQSLGLLRYLGTPKSVELSIGIPRSELSPELSLCADTVLKKDIPVSPFDKTTVTVAIRNDIRTIFDICIRCNMISTTKNIFS